MSKCQIKWLFTYRWLLLVLQKICCFSYSPLSLSVLALCYSLNACILSICPLWSSIYFLILIYCSYDFEVSEPERSYCCSRIFYLCPIQSSWYFLHIILFRYPFFMSFSLISALVSILFWAFFASDIHPLWVWLDRKSFHGFLCLHSLMFQFHDW